MWGQLLNITRNLVRQVRSGYSYRTCHPEGHSPTGATPHRQSMQIQHTAPGTAYRPSRTAVLPSQHQTNHEVITCI